MFILLRFSLYLDLKSYLKLLKYKLVPVACLSGLFCFEPGLYSTMLLLLSSQLISVYHTFLLFRVSGILLGFCRLCKGQLKNSITGSMWSSKFYDNCVCCLLYTSQVIRTSSPQEDKSLDQTPILLESCRLCRIQMCIRDSF